MTAAVAAFADSYVEWENVGEGNYVAGRRCSEGYLQGKVVLVCKDAKMASRMEEIWESFKTKPFVLLGSFDATEAKVTYPVYSGASLMRNEPSTPLYVVEETGRIRYKGKEERNATEALVSALTDMESPKSAAQWRMFLDYELVALPGRAYLRFLDFKKKMPKEAKEYETKFAELSKTENVKKLAELVKFAKEAKDVRAFDPKKAKYQKSRFEKMVTDAISKYSPLKESEDQRVRQEAKNALADLKWTLASL